MSSERSKAEEPGKLRPILFRLVLLVLTTVVGLVAVELGLRAFAPLAEDWHGNSVNTQRYGYGYFPYELVEFQDPDSPTVFSSRLNQSGWRDVDHTVENPDNNLRIVVVGDSNTFGYAVEFEDLYTRVLERKLNEMGYRAEVISFGYGGWGTDHALEVLTHEGLSYQPDLVLIQYCGNDVEDNVGDGVGGRKPFKYHLAEDGSLVRKEVKLQELEKNTRRLKWELAKRYRTAKLRWEERQKQLGYRFDEGTDFRIQQSCKLPPDDPLLEWLRTQKNEDLTPERVAEQCRLTGHADIADQVNRLLENRGFYQNWTTERFRPEPVTGTTPEWELLCALIVEMKERATAAGAEVMLLSDNEIGMYQWAVDWAMIEESPEAQRNYLSANEKLKELCRRNDIGFITHNRIHDRARNDAHPNAAGNEAMADNIIDFLKSEHGDLLERFKR